MGNSNWRLETTLNYIASELESIDKLHDVEIILVDWGSPTPLRSTLSLLPSAQRVLRYIEVPIDVHEQVCQGSDFPISIAFNVGIRRAYGEYIALTSGDVLWPVLLFNALLYSDQSERHLNHSLVFIPRRHVPWDFVSQSPPINDFVHYLITTGPSLPVEPLIPYYFGCAGALVMHRDLWAESRGNDERLVFWGYNDIDLCLRIRLKYRCLDFSHVSDTTVFHLEHYPSRESSASAPRKSNPHLFNPFTVNDSQWGLAQYKFNQYPEQTDPFILPTKGRKVLFKLYLLKHLINILLFILSSFSRTHFRTCYTIFYDYYAFLKGRPRT